MKKFKLLLLGGMGLVLAGALWWWLSERQLAPDERKYRSIRREFRLYIAVSMFRAKTPGQWLQAKLGSGGDYLMTRLGEKQNQLIASGYFTNYPFVVTNFPAQATNQNLKSAEISRRVQADHQISDDEFTSYSGPDDDGKISLTCRPCVLSNFVQAMNRP